MSQFNPNVASQTNQGIHNDEDTQTSSSSQVEKNKDPPIGYRPADEKTFVIKSLSKIYYFTKTNDGKGKNTWCSNCGSIRKYSKPTRLVEHANRCLPSRHYKLLALNNEIAARETMKRRSGKTISKEEKRAIDVKVVEMMAVNALPFNLTTSPQFRSLVNSLNPLYRTPSINTLRRVLLPKIAEKVQLSIRKHLMDAPPSSLAIEADGWTSISGISVVGITLTSHTGKSYLVDLVDVSGHSQTADFISDILRASLMRTKIPAVKFGSLVTDQGSNFRKARQTLHDDFRKSKFVVYEYRCMAHLFNLMIASMSKNEPVMGILKRMLDLIQTINRNKMILAYLRAQAAVKPVTPVATRWYTTSSAINSVLNLHTHLISMPKSREYASDKVTSFLRDADFWNDLKHLEVYYGKMSHAIGVSERRDSSLSQSFKALIELLRYLVIEADKTCRYRLMALDAVATHIIGCNVPLLLTAYALDPANRFRYVTSKGLLEIKKFVAARLLDLGQTGDIKSNVVEEFKQLRFDFGEAKELDNQLFWTNSKLLFIKKVALPLSMCHSSSANTERLFSGLSRLLVPSRNRMTIETLQYLMSIRMACREEPKESQGEEWKEVVEVERPIDESECQQVDDQDVEMMDLEMEAGIVESQDSLDDDLADIDQIQCERQIEDAPATENMVLDERLMNSLESMDLACGNAISSSKFLQIQTFINFEQWLQLPDSSELDPRASTSSGRSSDQIATAMFTEVDED